MKILRAEISDSSEIALVNIKAWQIAYKGIIEDEVLQSLSLKDRTKFWSDKIEDKEITTIVCKDDEEVIGFINFGKTQFNLNTANEDIEIWGLYVHPDRFRQRVGSSLLVKAEEEIFSNAFDRIVLHCFEDNESSRKFYEVMGYTLNGIKFPHPRFINRQLIEYEKRRMKR